MAASKRLTICNLFKRYEAQGKQIETLADINLTVEPGEFLSIIGPSGCGKSTLLRLIVGLDQEHDGSIQVGNEVVRGPGLDRGIVFQEHRLFPWLTVAENVAFGLDDRPAEERRELVERYLKMVGLEAFAHAYPHQLSGGMAQRVAIARALANSPAILLLDEPFGALDAFTRIQMQEEVMRIREQQQTTMILVTHDIDEAVYMGDRVAIMSSRPGTIRKIFDVGLGRPRDRASADFLEVRRRVYQEFFSQVEQPFAYSI